MTETIVIVGTGQGGFQAAASLRQDGFEGRIVMIGEEPSLPYQRPPLSKAYMKDGEAGRLLLRPEAFYDQNGIEMRRGCRVTAIDRDAREVTLTGGDRIGYDHLVLATGSRNLIPPVENVEAPGVFDLRTLEDAAALRNAMADARRAVVIGGGFIGLEFAAVARKAELEVSVVEMASRLMARVVSPEMSRRFAQMHTDMQTMLVFGQPVTGVLTAADGAACGVRLANGQEIDADLVLLAAGIAPNVELAEACGLTLDNGIAVDETLLTEDPAISALGDCAAFPPVGGSGRMRLESVQAATDHARAISKRLTGQSHPYTATPWFWSDQADWKLQIAGIGDGAEDTHVIEGHTGAVCVLRFRDDVLHAVETVNMAKEHMAARRLLVPGAPVTRDALKAVDYDLAALMKQRMSKAA